MQSTKTVSSAVEDFKRARQKAGMTRLLARLRGKSADLLSYEDVRRKLRAVEQSKQEFREIPIDDIVGSVGRYGDFTRGFFPTQSSDELRWATVKVASESLEGLPPIEVFQVGDVYFVKDGHHRISVAKNSGAEYVEAYITPVHTRVPLETDVDPEILLLKEEYADFLERTNLDRTRPGANINVTECCQYPKLLEQIDVHRYFLGIESNREIPFDEAAASWYDKVYLPVVEPIRELGILQAFPGRTETDLYIWILGYQAELAEELGWEIPVEDTALDFSSRFSRRISHVVSRMGEKLRDVITPDPLEGGPAVGDWRAQRKPGETRDKLLRDILVPLPHDVHDWSALDQALVIAHREKAHVHGIHVMEGPNQETDELHVKLEGEFLLRCAEAGVPATFLLDTGQVSRRICDRARWVDLVVMKITFAPPSSPFSKFGHGMRTILRRIPRPILVVPGSPSPLDRALLAYDGSPKAEEALFVSTYITKAWGTELSVLTSGEEGTEGDVNLERARAYLEDHDVQVRTIRGCGDATQEILSTIELDMIDLLVMGSYGASPLKEVILGSTVDRVLRENPIPTLICR